MSVYLHCIYVNQKIDPYLFDSKSTNSSGSRRQHSAGLDGNQVIPVPPCQHAA